MVFGQPNFGTRGQDRAFARAIRASIATFAAAGLVTLSIFNAGAPAQAVAGDDSIAESSFLSGTLLANLLPVGLDLGSSSASNDGTQGLQTDVSGIDALVGATAGIGVVDVPLVLADVGLLGTFAQAANDGSSIAAAGIANLDGDIGVALVDPSEVPSALTLDLSGVLVGGFAAELTRLQLDIGAASSRAESVAAAAATGNYEIVGSQLLLTSDTIAGVSATVGSLASTLSNAVDAVAGPSGSLLGTVTSTASAAFSSVGVVSLGDTSASVTLDLPAAIAPLLTEVTSGPVTVNFGTGEVAIDLAVLKGGSLSGLPANTAVLTSAELMVVSDAVTTLIDDFADELEGVVTAALGAAAVQIDVDLRVTLPLGIAAIDLAEVSVSGTLAQLAAGTGAISVNGLIGLPVVGATVDTLASALVAPLGLAISPIVAALLDPSDGALKAFIDGIQTEVVEPIAAALNPLLLTLDTILALTVNNQELLGVAPNQQFVETALRVGLLAQGPIASLVELDVARSAVGPNRTGVRPVITTIDPTSGPATGGTAVTITGTDFGGSTGVTFDGTAATDFTVVSDTEITVTSPAHAPGAVDVLIQHPAGASDAGVFTYTPVPVIASLAPDFGPVTGGTVVTITGSEFTGATAVTFDGDAGTSFSVDSDTQITVTSPAHALGAVDVIVERTTGDSAPATFTYRGVPTVSGLTPTEGPLAGGTVVTITGTGFTGSTGVTFDGDDGTLFTVVSDTEITVSSPAHAAATVAVVVLHPIGDASAGDFTYTAAPIVSSLSPGVGPVVGGTVVTIAGSGFTGATGVTFDGDAGTSFTVASDTEITVSTPAHAAGAVDVVVQSTPASSTPGTFTYLATPTVTSITPEEGPLAGGTVVTITGTGFTGATGVTFDGDAGTSFTVVSDTEIAVTTPPHAAGIAAVVVQHPVGDVAAGDFTYVAIPVVDTMVPLVGPDTGGTLITLRGSGFTGATGARFGGEWGTSFTVLSDTMATVVTPTHEAMWVPAVMAVGATELSTPGFTFQLTTLADADTGLAFTGSSGTSVGWYALVLIAVGAALVFSRRLGGRLRV